MAENTPLSEHLNGHAVPDALTPDSPAPGSPPVAAGPAPVNGTAHGSDTAPLPELDRLASNILGTIDAPRECSCGHMVDDDAANQCPVCGRILKGNRLALRTGMRGRGTPPAMARRIARFARRVANERGGWNRMSAIDRASLAQLIKLSRRLELQDSTIDRRGQHTEGGQQAFALMLSAVRTFKMVGDGLQPPQAHPDDAPPMVFRMTFDNPNDGEESEQRERRRAWDGTKREAFSLDFGAGKEK